MRNSGFPAEWEPHAATWLAWPNNPETWQGRLKFVQQAWVEMIKALHLHERVDLLVDDETMERTVRARFEKADLDLGRIAFHRIPTNDCWIRDTGPTFVLKRVLPLLAPIRRLPSLRSVQALDGGPPVASPASDLAAVCWQFNSWGEKWPPWDLDAKVAAKIAEKTGLPAIEVRLVLEGGSVETNGEGLLLTTESCLLHPKRNPQLKKGDIEDILKQSLGVSEVLWLEGEVPPGDDTDGHIDNLARFVGPRTVVTPLKPASRDYRRLAERFQVVHLPSPCVAGPDGSPLPASYANFYIANGVVLVPVFGDPADKEAIEILEPLFPKRRLVPILSRDLVLGFGGIHCVTQQQPQNCPSDR